MLEGKIQFILQKIPNTRIQTFFYCKDQ